MDVSPGGIDVLCHHVYLSGVICRIIPEKFQCQVICHIYIDLPLAEVFGQLLQMWMREKIYVSFSLKTLAGVSSNASLIASESLGQNMSTR